MFLVLRVPIHEPARTLMIASGASHSGFRPLSSVIPLPCEIPGKIMTRPQRALRVAYKMDMGRQMVECQLSAQLLSKLPKESVPPQPEFETIRHSVGVDLD